MSEFMNAPETEEPKTEASEAVAVQEISPPDPDVAEKAKQKLEEERKNARDKDFADPVIEHLTSRCEEDPGFASDILQEGKSWENCYEFIYKMARGMASQNRAVVRNDVVYEWAEDYYRMSPEQEKKANLPKASVGSAKKITGNSGKKASVKPAKKDQSNSKASGKPPKPEPTAKKPAEKEKKADNAGKAKPKNEIEGQMSLFDLL